MTRVRKTAEETVHGMHYETSVEAATLFAHATRVNGDGDESEGGAAGGARSDAGSDDSDESEGGAEGGAAGGACIVRRPSQP
jgi:hypothetical protein